MRSLRTSIPMDPLPGVRVRARVRMHMCVRVWCACVYALVCVRFACACRSTILTRPVIDLFFRLLINHRIYPLHNRAKVEFTARCVIR